MNLTNQDSRNIKQIVNEVVDSKVNSAVTDLTKKINELATNNDRRTTNLESTVDSIQRDFNQVLNRLDSLEKNVQLSEQERAVVSMQLARLRDWVDNAAAKIGIQSTQ
jgi:uncharacterized NAD(P)/FAD-binding protein YdhS